MCELFVIKSFKLIYVKVVRDKFIKYFINLYYMDVLKVFNLFVCTNNKSDITASWFFSILFAPITILFIPSSYMILAWISVMIFTYLIYFSSSPLLTVFNTDFNNQKSPLNSFISGVLLYMLQTTIILLFLRFTLCEKTLNWENRDYHVALQQYNNENIDFSSGY